MVRQYNKRVLLTTTDPPLLRRGCRVPPRLAGRGGGSRRGPVVATQAVAADADTEMTAMYAIMSLHEDYLVTPESQEGAVHFVLQLSPAASAAS